MGIRHKIWDIKTPVSNSYVSKYEKKNEVIFQKFISPSM